MRQKLFSVGMSDLRVEAIASTGGAGGQHKNRRHTAIRLTHEPSGAVGYSADERSQLQNKIAALHRLAATPAFKQWAHREAARLAGQPSIEQQIEEAMHPRNLVTERRDEDGRWVLWSDV